MTACFAVAAFAWHQKIEGFLGISQLLFTIAVFCSFRTFATGIGLSGIQKFFCVIGLITAISILYDFATQSLSIQTGIIPFLSDPFIYIALYLLVELFLLLYPIIRPPGIPIYPIESKAKLDE